MREGILYISLILVSVFLGLIFAFVFRQPNVFFFASAIALVIYFGIARKIIATVTATMIFLEFILGYGFGQLALPFILAVLLLYWASDFFTISPLKLHNFSIAKWVSYSVTGALLIGIVSFLNLLFRHGFKPIETDFPLALTLAIHGGIQVFIALILMTILLNNSNAKEKI